MPEKFWKNLVRTSGWHDCEDEQVAERAGISRPTLLSIEKGSPSVSIGSFLQVLMVLGLENDLLSVAKDDELGRKLQDLNLTPKKRAPKIEK